MNTELPKKKKFEKLKRFFNNVIKPIIRGTLKQIPLGSAIVEISDNIKTSKAIENGEKPKRASIKDNNLNVPHSALSIFIQIALGVCIVYAFVTKQITVQDIINLLDYFSPVNDNPVSFQTINDTIQ